MSDAPTSASAGPSSPRSASQSHSQSRSQSPSILSLSLSERQRRASVSTITSVATSVTDGDAEGARSRATERKPLSLSEQESVMIAVRALDDMRSSRAGPPRTALQYSASTSAQQTPALSVASTSTSPSVESQYLTSEDVYSPDFVARVSGLPIVHTALKAYEQSKASSRVVKYGAEMMESSVRSISRPVIERLPVNQLDEFACRQLDRFHGYRDRSSSQDRDRHGQRRNRGEHDRDREGSPSSSDVGFREQIDTDAQDSSDTAGGRRSRERALVNHSRWQNILFEAGGIGAAVSEESMRRLKYCLQWLQYATGNIDAQMLVLRNFIASIRQQDSTNDQFISASHFHTLTEVKRNVVNTIRQVVDVVSKYAGGALPEPARVRVRQFILLLPQRWASSAQILPHAAAPHAHTRTAEQPQGSSKKRRTNGGSASSSPVLSTASTSIPEDMDAEPQREREDERTGPGLPLPVTVASSSHPRPLIRTVAANQAAQRILTLATESLDMMRSVTGVFKESLDRAEAWVERLRVIGIQRQSQGATGESGSETETDPILERERTRRGDADGDDDDTGSVAWNVPSPMGMAATHLDALSLSSVTSAGGYATPRSTLSSLPTPTSGGKEYPWAYGHTDGDERDVREEGTTGAAPTRPLPAPGVSAVRWTPLSESTPTGPRSPGMDVDEA